MTLSWKELVCHGFLVKVGDPSLVRELLEVAMKRRLLFLEEKARMFNSMNVGMVVNVYRHEWRRWNGLPGRHWDFVVPTDRALLEGGELRRRGHLGLWQDCPEVWQTALRYKNLKKEFSLLRPARSLMTENWLHPGWWKEGIQLLRQRKAWYTIS